jgi:hypothetical protein
MTNLLKKVTVGVMLMVTMAATAGPAFAQGSLLLNTWSRVSAHTMDIWRVQTFGTFRVVVDGDGDTDLDVFVYDAVTGELLGLDDDATDYCIVSGYAPSGRIRVEVHNLGRVYNEYEITVRR